MTITLTREEAQQVLDALEYNQANWQGKDKAIKTFRARLSQCERCGEKNPAEIHTCTPKEPVAWLIEFENGEQELHFVEQAVGETQIPLYTAPPQREWQGLTEEEKLIVNQMWNMVGVDGSIKAIETRLKEKNA
jgi:hypothetical protein